MTRAPNGHTSSKVFEGSTLDNCTVDYDHAGYVGEGPVVPLALTGAEGFVFTLAPIAALVFLALFWLHYAERGK